MAVGDRIRELLQSHDMTQKQLADALSIPLTTLSGYVRNYREPDYATLKLLAGYFGVTCDYLLENNPVRNSQSNMSVLSGDEMQFLNTCRALRPEQNALLRAMADYMYEQQGRTQKNSTEG